MTLLDNKNGIICDICNATHTDDFTYYSYDFRKVRVINNIMDVLNYKSAPVLSLDVCTNCHGKLKDVVTKHYKPSPCLPTRNYHQGVYCDFTTKRMSGTYEFYHGVITEAVVRMSHKPYICVDCRKVVKDTNTQECPHCHKTNGFAKNADITSIDRAVEIWICQEAFDKLKPSEEQLQRRKEAAEWSSSAE